MKKLPALAADRVVDPWLIEPVVPRFAADQAKGHSTSARLSRAVALTMDDSGLTRDEIAERMSASLEGKVSKGMLDGYASQAREQHSISAARLAALVAITGDARALNLLLEGSGLVVVPEKYEPLLRREKARELIERAREQEQVADAEWKAAQ